MTPGIVLLEIDRKIWQEELADFVPARVFDVHTHAYCWDANLDPDWESGPFAPIARRGWKHVDWHALNACDRKLLPDRTVNRLTFPFPFAPRCDFERANRFVAEQVRLDPESAALMLVQPAMQADYLERWIEEHSFLGLKPYRFYAIGGDAVECDITDFLPEEQIAVADRRGLIVMLHLAKREGIANPRNLDALSRLTQTYPGVRWILAHCARAYSAWPIEKAGPRLRQLENVWYDVSSVCESDAITALIDSVGPERVMYGSDDIPVGVMRGKYIAFGYAWAFLSEDNHQLQLSHCRPEMTFTRYEQLRAMRRAAQRIGMTGNQIDALFFDTAYLLVQSARTGNRHPSP